MKQRPGETERGMKGSDREHVKGKRERTRVSEREEGEVSSYS